MNLCDYGHDEVSYKIRQCPVCALIRENEKLESKIAAFKEMIVVKNNELERLYARVGILMGPSSP